MEYDVVIGLEVHSELKTKTKVFCSCKNEFGSEPNTNCCPVCLGFPGTLPKLNREVVNFAVNRGHEAAMIAGIDYAKGDAIVCMDADLQHPPKAIPAILAKTHCRRV